MYRPVHVHVQSCLSHCCLSILHDSVLCLQRTSHPSVKFRMLTAHTVLTTQSQILGIFCPVHLANNDAVTDLDWCTGSVKLYVSHPWTGAD